MSQRDSEMFERLGVMQDHINATIEQLERLLEVVGSEDQEAEEVANRSGQVIWSLGRSTAMFESALAALSQPGLKSHALPEDWRQQLDQHEPSEALGWREVLAVARQRLIIINELYGALYGEWCERLLDGQGEFFSDDELQRAVERWGDL